MDIMTIVNKFALQSNRAVVVEKETQRDKKKGLIKHTFLFAQLLNPTRSHQPSQELVPSTDLKSQHTQPTNGGREEELMSPNTGLEERVVEEETTIVVNETTELVSKKSPAEESLSKLNPMNSDEVLTNVIMPEPEAFKEESNSPDNVEGNRRRKKEEKDIEVESPEDGTVSTEFVDERSLDAVFNTPETAQTGTRLVSGPSEDGGNEKPAPKSRASLHSNFPRLPEGTRTFFRDGNEKEQSQLRKFLRPMLDEEGRASGE